MCVEKTEREREREKKKKKRKNTNFCASSNRKWGRGVRLWASPLKVGGKMRK